MVHLKIYMIPSYDEESTVEVRKIYIVVDSEHKAEVYEEIKAVCKIHYKKTIPSRPSVPRGCKGVIAIEVKIPGDFRKISEWYHWFNVELLDRLEKHGWNLLIGENAFDGNGLIFKKVSVESEPEPTLDEVLRTASKRRRRI